MNISKEVRGRRAGKGSTDYSKCKCKERRARLALASSTSLWAGSVLARSRKVGYFVK